MYARDAGRLLVNHAAWLPPSSNQDLIPATASRDAAHDRRKRELEFALANQFDSDTGRRRPTCAGDALSR